MDIRFEIDDKIRLPLKSTPIEVIEYLKIALDIPNVEKKEAARHHLWGWQNMPDTIQLWEEDEHDLIVPRGFLSKLLNGLAKLGYRTLWDGCGTCIAEAAYEEPILEPYSWQSRALDSIERNMDGIYQAPAGSGKTATVLFAIQKLGLKALVIVNTKDILWQWQERVEDFLGPNVDVGQIGDDDFYVSEQITIGTAQTLHRRYDELVTNGFFDSFGFVCLDECHHATADTYRRLVNSFTSCYRLGVSATPEKTGDFKLAEIVLGPVFHVTEPGEVDSLIKPKIIVVNTDFYFPFRQTESRYKRSNYPELLKALTNDPERNNIIKNKILENSGTHQLVISKRLEHLDHLYNLVEAAGYPDPMIKLTGKETPEDRQYAKNTLETRPCIVFSTLADEALDIPRLDRIHLAYPQRNVGLVTQQIGRVERQHEDKSEALVYDYADRKVGVLDSQYKTRLFEVYKKRSLEICISPSHNGRRSEC